MIIHYLKIAFRNLWKYKFQNAIGILGVAVGLVCFTFCCYIPRFLGSIDQFYPGADRMYCVSYSGPDLTVGLGQKLQEQFPGDIEKTTFIFPSVMYEALFEWNNDIKNEYEIFLSEADSMLTDFFSLEFVAGNPQSATKSFNSILLFEDFAQKIGKPNDLIGKVISIKDKLFHITGIVKNLPKNTSLTLFSACNGFMFNSEVGLFQRLNDDPVFVLELDFLFEHLLDNIDIGNRNDHFQNMESGSGKSRGSNKNGMSGA